MQYLKAFPHALRPVLLSREAEAPAVAGEDGEGEGHTVATQGTTPVTNQQQ